MATSVALSKTELKAEILRLKKEKNAVILAHYYQEPEVQDLADYVGDSLGLSQQAAQTDADIIVFAGVHFMAETAKILNPTKKVVLPDPAASCSLAESCEPADFKAFVEAHPGHVVISYINCSAGIKALSDLICTSANAEKMVNSVPKDTPIIFVSAMVSRRESGRGFYESGGEHFLAKPVTTELLDDSIQQVLLKEHSKSDQGS